MATFGSSKFINNHCNHIKIGLVGSSNVGKTSLFNHISRIDPYNTFAVVDDNLFTTIDPNIGWYIFNIIYKSIYIQGIFFPVDDRIEYLMTTLDHKTCNRIRATVIDTAGIVQGSYLDVMLFHYFITNIKLFNRGKVLE